MTPAGWNALAAYAELVGFAVGACLIIDAVRGARRFHQAGRARLAALREREAAERQAVLDAATCPPRVWLCERCDAGLHTACWGHGCQCPCVHIAPRRRPA